MADYIDERGNRVSTSDDQRTVRLSAIEARQGLLGRPVLVVLIAGLALAVVAWAGVELFGEASDNDAITQVQENSPAATQQVAPDAQTTIDNQSANGQQMQPAPADESQNTQNGSGG